MQCKSGDDNDDAELVRKDEMTVTGIHHRQVGEVLYIGSSFQRRGEAWQKERLTVVDFQRGT